MVFKLRNYQINICRSIGRAIDNGKKKILLSAPTGAGKTAIFTDFATRLKTIGKKTLIVVDRIELLKQTIKHNNTFGYLTSDSFVNGDVCVAMLQTLRARLKHEKYQEWLECFDIVFFDEIHQFYNGSSFKTICELTKNDCTIVGVTATPWNDKGYLLEGFDEFINEVEIKDLIEQGYLVEPEHYTVDLFDFSNVKITKTGEYDAGQVDDIVVDTDKIDKVFDGWKKYAGNKKTIVFCTTVNSAKHYADFFKLNGVKAECISAQNSDTERVNILTQYKNNQIQVLFNVGLLVAGFDEPSIECVVFLNPTKMLRRYIQCAGRGLRLCPEIGKEKCIFLDFVGNSFRHLEVDAIRSYIPAPPKKEMEDFDEIECPVCGFIFPISGKECPQCGFILDFNEGEGCGCDRPKNKKEFEKLIKLKSVQQELHDVVYSFADLPCLIKIEKTGNLLSNGREEKKWVYGYRDDGSPIFKSSKDYSIENYPYPLIANAKKTNCWYVFKTICTKFNPQIGALRYYGKKLRKAKRFLEQIQNPDNKGFVNLYKLIDD